ncbi:MAG: MmcQ/YjbR family DNA-binding protein, partial [Tepidisphaeraceae bacterium]
MRIVLVNNSSETFTPTHSGAIATWIWECCRAARSCGAEPIVISRSAQLKPYEWPNTVFVDYPAITGGKMASYFFRLQRKLNGWRHMRQKAFAARVAHAVRKLDAEESTLVLHNDPEMAVLLRERFPKASILHHFHNQEQCKEV